MNCLLVYGKNVKKNGNPHEMLCPCGICTGFGKGREKGKYNKTTKIEAYHKYEYPGIHRSLLWSLKAVIFYLDKTNSSLGYSFKQIESGYRCQDRNIQKGRVSTNHMGKALDLHFNKNGQKASSVKEMEDIRLNIFNKYLGAKWDWKYKNIFNLESTAIGATSWVHYDVREFDTVYLKDEYFTKTKFGLNGKSILVLAKELAFTNTCNCLGITKVEKKEDITDCTICTTLTKERKKFYEEFGESSIKMVKNKEKSNKFKGLYMVAQRRQENGFKLKVPNNNPMNIKGKGDLGSFELNTHEYINGQKVYMKDGFANFSSIEKGFEGYLDLLNRNFHFAYEAVIDDSKNIDDFLTGLQDKGRIGAYATDPNYKTSIKTIFNGVVKDYKKWLECKLSCNSYSSKKKEIEEDIQLLEKLK